MWSRKSTTFAEFTNTLSGEQKNQLYTKPYRSETYFSARSNVRLASVCSLINVTSGSCAGPLNECEVAVTKNKSFDRCGLMVLLTAAARLCEVFVLVVTKKRTFSLIPSSVLAKRGRRRGLTEALFAADLVELSISRCAVTPSSSSEHCISSTNGTTIRHSAKPAQRPINSCIAGRE